MRDHLIVDINSTDNEIRAGSAWCHNYLPEGHEQPPDLISLQDVAGCTSGCPGGVLRCREAIS